MNVQVLFLLVLVALTTACPFASLLSKRGTHGLKLDSTMRAKMAAAHKGANVDVAADSRKRALDPEDVVETFVLTSRVKTAGSPVFQQGFPVGYAVNGVETPTIDVVSGRTYKFTVESGCNHPFYLTTDSRGKGRAPMNTGFDTPPAQERVCSGKSILWKPDDSLIGTDIFYQCTVHDNMGFLVKVRKQTLCEKYTEDNKAFFPNSNDLLTSVVSAVFDNLISGDIAEYFDGSLGDDQTDFTSDGVAAAALAESLVSFFAGPDFLDCRDGSIPPYAGPSMSEVHKNMPIGKFEYDSFNAAIGKALEGTFEAADLDAFIAILNSNEVRGEICNADVECIETICSKYGEIAFPGAEDSQAQFMAKLVLDATNLIIADDSLKGFFDGSIPPGSQNFFADGDKFNALKAGLVSFFGRADVLTCPQETFPATEYTIDDLKETHINMPITTEVFNKFNDHVIAAAANLGASAEDQATIRAVLDSTEPLICNQPGCSTIPLADKQFELVVKKKADTHHFFNKGFPAAFTIDGEDVEGLVLTVGETYSFKVNSGCLHPFYLSDGGTGAGSTELEDGVSPIGQSICNGKALTFEAKAEHVGKQLFYACRNHNFMGGVICVVNPGDEASTDCEFVDAEEKTFCDEMTDNFKTAALMNNLGEDVLAIDNSKKVLERVVTDLFVAGTQGAAAGLLKKYFDGTKPAGSTDFTTDAEERTALVDGLVRFFGTNLGCSDNSIDIFEATDVQPNMKTVHQFMEISKEEFDGFNNGLLALLQNVAGSGAGLSAASATKVSVFLNTTSTDICFGCPGYSPPTLCEKWATAAGKSQFEIVSGAVVAVFTKIIDAENGGLAKDFFDGTVPCESRNFISNTLNQANLVKSLTAFFGQPNVLGCTDSKFPRYVGEGDMELVHRNMPITKAIFEQFNTALIDHLTAALPESLVPSINADLAAVLDVLGSPGITVICNQDDCDAPKGTFAEKVCDVPPAPTDAPTDPPTDDPTTEDSETEGSESEDSESEDDSESEEDSETEEAPVDGMAPAGAASVSLAVAAAFVALVAAF